MSGESLGMIAQAVSTMAMIWMIFCWMSQLYGSVQNKWRLVIGYLVSCGGLILINQFRIPIVNFVYSLVQINVIAMVVFEKTLRESVLYNVLYQFVLVICDTLAVLGWTLALGESPYAVLEDGVMHTITCLVNILIMYVCYRMFVLVFSSVERSAIRMGQIVTLLAVNVFAFWVIHKYSSKIQSQRDGLDVIIIIVGFLVLNVIFVYMIRQISMIYRREYELSVMHKQSQMQLEHYQRLSDKYEESRRMIHDVKKHLRVLNTIQSADIEKAEEYRRTIEQQLEEMLLEFHCSNPMLNVVIGQKLKEAQEKGIRLKTELQDVSIGFMEDMDITSLFANLWDNAIEATSHLSKEKRYIDFTMGSKEAFLIICVENTFDGTVIQKNGKYMSSKDGHAGLGLGIIREIAEKYHGNCTVTVQENRFQISVVILIQ